MELQEFIRTSLIQISKGVSEANKELKGRPPFQMHAHKDGKDVNFDIALFAIKSNKGTGKAGLEVASIIAAGGKLERTKSEENISRIKFCVSIINPIV